MARWSRPAQEVVAVAGWAALHERLGSLPFPEVLAPAIEYAEKGFAVSPVVHQKWAAQADALITSALRTLETEAAGINALAAAIGDGLGEAFIAAVELMRQARGRVIVTGMGKSGHVGRRIAASRLEERRRQIDTLDQRVADLAAGGIRGRRGIAHDQGHLHGRLVEQILLAQPVVAQVVAVIGGEHDQRAVEEAARLEEGHQHAQLVVDLLDQAHVDGNDFGAHLVARKRLAGVVFHEGAIDRMRIAALALRAHRRNDIVGPLHGVVRRRRDVGPVRLDVGQMQAPRLFSGLADEIDAAPGHIRRLGILLTHPRRLPRMAHRPA